jgi:hypothetical protein
MRKLMRSDEEEGRIGGEKGGIEQGVSDGSVMS